MFPSASSNCLDLLSSLLQFNPDKRISPTEAMLHPYFDGIKAQGYVNNPSHKVVSSRSTGNQKESSTGSSPSSGSTDNCRNSNISCHSGNSSPLDAAREKQNESPANIRKNVRIECLSANYYSVIFTIFSYWYYSLSQNCYILWPRRNALRNRRLLVAANQYLLIGMFIHMTHYCSASRVLFCFCFWKYIW